jgi:YaaC-like Protein
VTDSRNSEAWRLIRLLRSRQPGETATQADRAQAFWMALEQGEQLWRAAEAVDASVSPIPLFYGLMQGGFALSAAPANGDSWRFNAKHGLRVVCPRPETGKIQSLDNILVKTNGGKGSGLYVVAEIFDSPVSESGEVSLAELACSLPEAEDLMVGFDHTHPIRVNSGIDAFFRGRSYRAFHLTVGPVPDEMATSIRDSSPAGPTYNRPALADVAKWLEPYPGLANLGQPTGLPQVTPDTSTGDLLLIVEWLLSPAKDGAEVQDYLRSLLDVDESEGGRVSGIIMPTVADNPKPQHQLIAWWLLLFGFSMVARYHPETWVELLNVDRSKQAVPIEVMLERAAAQVPALLYTEIAAAVSDEE